MLRVLLLGNGVFLADLGLGPLPEVLQGRHDPDEDLVQLRRDLSELLAESVG